MVLNYVPIALIITRFIIGIFLVIMTVKARKISRLFLFLFIFGVFSDFIDGVIARHIGLSSTKLCIFDGYADLILYSGTFFSLWLAYPKIIGKSTYALLLLLLFQIVSWIFCYIKFGTTTSWHTYIAKIFGISLFLSIVEIIILKQKKFLLIMICLGVIYLSEDIAITAIMPYWRPSVVSIKRAMALRDNYNIKH